MSKTSFKIFRRNTFKLRDIGIEVGDVEVRKGVLLSDVEEDGAPANEGLGRDAVVRARRDDELAAGHAARGAAAAAGGLRLVQRVPRRELHLTNIPDIRTPLLPEVDR